MDQAAAELGWRPTFTFEDAVAATVAADGVVAGATIDDVVSADPGIQELNAGDIEGVEPFAVIVVIIIAAFAETQADDLATEEQDPRVVTE